MAEHDNATDAATGQANGADNAPMANVITQYVKDYSFENPNSPAVYQTQSAPAVDVQFNIQASQVSDDVHEVVLRIEVKATMDDKPAFLVDLSYAGLFGLRNIPAEHLQPFLLGEGPRLLFPFARRILADAVRDGGFPPLMLEPIDFAGLYYQQQAQAQAAGELAGEAGPVGNA